MKIFFILLLFTVGTMSCSIARPPDAPQVHPLVEYLQPTKPSLEVAFPVKSLLPLCSNPGKSLAFWSQDQFSLYSIEAQRLFTTNHSEEYIFLDDLKNCNLFASLGPHPDDFRNDSSFNENSPEETSLAPPEKSTPFTFEGIMATVLFIFTTLFGTLWKKGKGKLKQFIDLATFFQNALEDDTITKAEIEGMKLRFNKLINNKTSGP